MELCSFTSAVVTIERAFRGYIARKQVNTLKLQYKATKLLRKVILGYMKCIRAKQIAEKRKRDKIEDDQPLPDSMEWFEVAMVSQSQIDIVSSFLRDYYVTDESEEFRFDYGSQFIEWILSRNSLIVGIRSKISNEMLGMIAGIPQDVRIDDNVIPMFVVDFVCLHPSVRNQRLTPKLYKELQRRMGLIGRTRMLYTSGSELRNEIGDSMYYHRPLNLARLVNSEFWYPIPEELIDIQEKQYDLSDKQLLSTFRVMTKEDIPSVYSLLTKYLLNPTFRVALVYSIDDIERWFLPIENVMYTYVNCDPYTNEITDFFSFNIVHTTVLQHPILSPLRIAYSFYNVCTSLALPVLMMNALIAAKMANADVFNCLDIMENRSFLRKLNFTVGSAILHYYLTPTTGLSIMSHQNAIILF